MTADYEAARQTREGRRREVIAQQLGEFPRELARCTCNRPSFNRDDHANTCPLGPTPPLSSLHATPATRGLPEARF